LVQFLGDNLEEEASEWFTQLNDEGAPELNNVDDFLRELQSHFEDSSRVQEAEAEIKSIRQKGRPAKELVLEFRCLATNLRHWSQRILVHYFQERIPEILIQYHDLVQVFSEEECNVLPPPIATLTERRTEKVKKKFLGGQLKVALNFERRKPEEERALVLPDTLLLSVLKDNQIDETTQPRDPEVRIAVLSLLLQHEHQSSTDLPKVTKMETSNGGPVMKLVVSMRPRSTGDAPVQGVKIKAA
ncbi:Retrotransposon-like protein 1, partial [Ophiophagus hannah]